MNKMLEAVVTHKATIIKGLAIGGAAVGLVLGLKAIYPTTEEIEEWDQEEEEAEDESSDSDSE